MAKSRDGDFAKTKTDWHRDPRCRALVHPSYKWLNQVLWQLCVKERRETLPAYYDPATLAHEAGIDVRTVRRGLTLMQQECINLITVNKDQTITVHGVREIHENKSFRFLDDKEISMSPRVEKRESKSIEKSREGPNVIDPFFKDNGLAKMSGDDLAAHRIVSFSLDNYKASDNSGEILPFAMHLLASGVSEQDIQAALMAKAEMFPDMKYRPNFRKALANAAEVQRLAGGEWRESIKKQTKKKGFEVDDVGF